ncbi:MAG: trigger factor [Deltaproteobacteria bacterium]|nr:trigger factor [Deltaproteobacteria bacterium]MBW1966175.1 trigger factor [Deltaproteobacteria bacterium]MBW2097494.1 trigger factor [Deltaproteobacteria bacterium]
MKVSVEDIGPIQKRLLVEIPADMVSKEFDSAYRQLKKRVNIKGFRKGKAPRSILERHYGPQVESEVLESLIKQSLPEALKEANVELLLDPQLDLTSPLKTAESFSYSALLDLWPEFELPKYKGLELIEPVVEVSEEEIREQLEALRRHFATVESAGEDRPVEKEDLAVIDYAGEIDGKPVDGLSEENYYLEVGAGYFNSVFEEQMLGMTKGIEKSIEVSYPEDALNAKVAGKTVKFKVVLKDIKKRILPELNDDFAKQVGADIKTVEELRDRLRNQLEEDKKKAAKSSLRQQFLEQLREQVDFPVPDKLVDAKLTQMVDNVRGYLQERGVDLERAGMSEDRLRAKMREDAVKQVKTEIILDKIAETENIAVDHDEVSEYTKYIEGRSKQLGVDKRQLQNAVVRNVLPKLRAKKTVDFLLKQVVVKPASREID